MDHRPYDAWEVKRDGARKWALAKAQQVLHEYHPDPLEAGMKQELMRIIHSVEK
jgi:hypothetical protein